MPRIPNPKSKRPNPKFKFDRDNRPVMPESQANWPTRKVVARCTTPDCVASGVGFDATVGENVDSIYQIECAQCGQEPEMWEPGQPDTPATDNNWVHPSRRRTK